MPRSFVVNTPRINFSRTDLQVRHKTYFYTNSCLDYDHLDLNLLLLPGIDAQATRRRTLTKMRVWGLFALLGNTARAEHIEATCICESECKDKPVTSQCHADVMIMMDSSVCHAGERWELIRNWSFGAAKQLKV